MDEEEIRKSAALEERHWWYAGRRAMVRRELAGLPAGRALDIGCGSGGNSDVLRRLGWQVAALDYSEEATAAALADDDELLNFAASLAAKIEGEE